MEKSRKAPERIVKDAQFARSDPMAEILRLKKWAKRLRVADDDLEDVAMAAYLRGLECGVPEWFFTSVCLKNIVLAKRRNERRRAAVSLADEDIVELKKLHVRPTQEGQLLFSQAAAFIGTLHVVSQKVLAMTAEDASADEIAEALEIPKTEVYWRLQHSRRLMRDHGLYDATAKGSKYVGVRREGHKWNASIREDGKFRYLGSFASPEEAAKVYQAEAARLGRVVRRKKGSQLNAAA